MRSFSAASAFPFGRSCAHAHQHRSFPDARLRLGRANSCGGLTHKRNSCRRAKSGGHRGAGGDDLAFPPASGRSPAIKHVEHIQNHPKFYRAGDLFVHFYGNHAPCRIPPEECEEVFRRWEDANRQGAPFPADRARFHWCCIQNKRRRGLKFAATWPTIFMTLKI